MPFAPPPKRRRQAGLTLIELMVVVVIVGILSGVAFVMISRGPKLGLVATEMASAVGEASRKAVAEGSLEPAIVANEGFTARARLFIDDDASGRQFYAVEVRRKDTATTSAWFEVSRNYLPEGMTVAGTEAGVARTEPGGSVTPVPANGFELTCEPSGQCQAGTIYLETDGSQGQQKRVVVMPLSAAPLVLDGW